MFFSIVVVDIIEINTRIIKKNSIKTELNRFYRLISNFVCFFSSIVFATSRTNSIRCVINCCTNLIRRNCIIYCFSRDTERLFKNVITREYRILLATRIYGRGSKSVVCDSLKRSKMVKRGSTKGRGLHDHF